MKYAHIISYFNNAPWAILPEKLYAIISIIELRAAGLSLSDAEIESRIGPREPNNTATPTSVAILPIFGTISNRIGLLKRASGGMSVEQFTQDFRAAVRDPNVGAIILDIDSPGGSTAGIEELSDEIFEARAKKRIIAAVNSEAASAAYWLASSAHEVALTPSGHVGSIGVLGVHMDLSERAKSEGINVTVVSAGKHKAEASEFTPLSQTGRDALQALVDDRYDAFVRNVARGRRVSQKAVREGFGEGRMVTARAALSEGMVDSIETLDQVIARTAGRAVRARKLAEAASWQIGLMGDENVFDLGARVIDTTAQNMAAGERQSFVVQAVIGIKSEWKTIDDLRNWAKEHGYRADRTGETEREWQLWQRNEDDFQQLKRTANGQGIVLIGGKLKPGLAGAVFDAAADSVDEFLRSGVIPQDVSKEIAPEGTTWGRPTLKDFSSKSWEELTDNEKRRIAMHAAWASAMPPETFDDIKLFHHRPSDGAVVPNGVRNALARLNQTEGLGDDAPRVEAHLRAHMEAIQRRRESAKARPELDSERAVLELLELG